MAAHRHCDGRRPARGTRVVARSGDASGRDSPARRPRSLAGLYLEVNCQDFLGQLPMLPRLSGDVASMMVIVLLIALLLCAAALVTRRTALHRKQ